MSPPERLPARWDDAAGAAACPVCDWAGDDAACPACGWQLSSGHALGAATGAQLDAFRERLDRARRRYDLLAAVRAAGRRGARDPAALTRLQRLVRALPVADGELDDAVREVDAATPPTAGHDALNGLVRQLVEGAIDRLDLLEVGADGIASATLEVDEAGVPAPLGAGEPRPWPALLPMLSADRFERRFQLAGGIGLNPIDQDAAAAALAAVVPGVVPSRPRGERSRLVLVRRAPGWPIPERAARIARAARPPDLEVVPDGPDVPLMELVADLARQAPLKRPYDLVLAALEEGTGAVTLRRRRLFAAGTAVLPGEPPARDVDVLGPPGTGGPLALPVVACPRDGAPAGDWTVVGMGSATIPSRTRARIRVVLEGPGQVRFDEPPTTVNESRPWSELLASLPDRLDVAPLRPVDLVIAVELCGQADAVDTRCALLQELLAIVDQAHPDLGDVRVGLIGYDDHAFGDLPPGGADSPLRIHRFGAPADAMETLQGWEPGRWSHDHATAVEDALVATGRMDWRAGGSQRMLLFAGARPPHPPRQERDLCLPCPGHHDWEPLLERLRSRLGLRCYAVTEPPPALGEGSSRELAARRAATAWPRLGSEGLLDMREATAERLAEITGLLPSTDVPALSFALAAPIETAAAGSPRRL